ncbi:MAG: anhydro-N-acetylmuramic acid kinase [Lentimicrobium sp.]|jgi:anhydro-N-acetylmuramic acid kinase|nr:anhydro-N-acetylmuramic acid kinase [Lentimicrobium sp.]
MSSDKAEKIQAIGLMSGTSLDGLDIAQCTFHFSTDEITFQIDHCQTISYPDEISRKLRDAEHSNALDFCRIDAAYGKWVGETCRTFMDKHRSDPMLIASHGHTIFHNPKENFTTQIGNGAQIAAATKVRTVCDFRSLDVALGGQGAPLVPIGDRLLFKQYDACVNIGGFSNISMEQHAKRIAWDICPANYLLNHYAAKLGMNYDESGNTARKGTTITKLLKKLNQLDYYVDLPPKSLGREWVEAAVFPLIKEYEPDYTGILNTLTLHIAAMIGQALPKKTSATSLFTGGGVHNTFLMEQIASVTTSQQFIPDKQTIDFKESLIFALLGVLRYKKIPNCLCDVTGASLNNIGGAVYEI